MVFNYEFMKFNLAKGKHKAEGVPVNNMLPIVTISFLVIFVWFIMGHL